MDCAICLEGVARLPATFNCGHGGCVECIRQYVGRKKSKKCMMCRGRITGMVVDANGLTLSKKEKRAVLWASRWPKPMSDPNYTNDLLEMIAWVFLVLAIFFVAMKIASEPS